MRRRKPVRIGELWTGFVSENPAVSRKLCEARIPEVWERVAGTAIASLTRSLEVKNGILHVAMTSSVARHEIFMKREELKNRINAELGTATVRSIIVK